MKSPHTRNVLIVVLVVLLAGEALVIANPAGAQDDFASVSLADQNSISGNASQRLNVTEMRAPQNASVGDTITVSATIRNPKSSKVTKPVALRFDGDYVTRRRVTVPADGTKNVSFSLDTSNGSSGSHVLSVQTYRFGEVRTVEFGGGGGNATNNETTTFNNTSTTSFNNTSTTSFNNTSTTSFNNTTSTTAFNNTTSTPSFNNTTSTTSFNNTTSTTSFNNTTTTMFNNTTTTMFNNTSTTPFNNSSAVHAEPPS